MGKIPVRISVGHLFFIFSTLVLVNYATASYKFQFNKSPKLPEKREGTAVIITGAAAKIAQEAALLQTLYEKGELKNVVFISGASSGALNAVLLNGILEGKITWDDYKNILADIKNSDVFKSDGDKLPVDNEPLRELVTRIVVKRLGYQKLSDLPIPTSLSVVNLRAMFSQDRTLRLSNLPINSESDPNINIVDVLMASTAYPLVFPPAKIESDGDIPDVPLYDGGIADDRLPYKALIDFIKYRGVNVEKVIIVSRSRDKNVTVGDEMAPFGFDVGKLVQKVNISPDEFSEIGFKKRLREYGRKYPKLADRTIVYVPDYERAFLMFNFNDMEEQYNLTYKWAQNNPPKPFDEFLQDIKKE
ncbi:MAG: patatin-like phospholipase family protein [Bacteroidales bacterium]|nr:patatin-like phospholipase family protein [Bacteroidales bacterium]HPD95386.1 patatin-like phospholipase family protein [Tenuifilaceae bacterium]HRX30605.1 patatin-like phospholipase family protein [Tenuifilaceae bacterium]